MSPSQKFCLIIYSWSSTCFYKEAMVPQMITLIDKDFIKEKKKERVLVKFIIGRVLSHECNNKKENIDNRYSFFPIPLQPEKKLCN